MGSSSTLVAPGLRTAPNVSWRSGVGTAVAVICGQPALWLVGALGFVSRGGAVLLALPMVVVPSPIQVRLMLGEGLSSGGLTAGFFQGLVPLALVGAAVVAVALALAAQAELVAFERLVTDPESEDQLDGRVPRRLSPAARRQVVGWLFLVQVGALAALALAALPLLAAVYDVTVAELLRPSPGGASLYSRVLSGARDPLFLLLPAVVVVDILSAAASRALLVRSFGLASPHPGRGPLRSVVAGLARPFRHPLRAVATALLAWGTTLLVLPAALWAVDVTADATRAAFLSPRAVNPELMPWLLVMTLVFAAVWAVALIVAGFVSAVRAALWTTEALN